MYSVQEGRWDPQRPSNHAWTPRPGPPSNLRLAHLETATPAKRITFYTSGDNQFRGVRMAIHKRSFKCFDALLDDLSQKVPLPFGVRTVTTPRGTRIIKHLEELQDGGCYLCSDRRQPKPVNMELASKHQSIWHHHSRIPPKAETFSTPSSGHLAQRHRRILLVKNTEPGMRRNIGLSRRSIRSMRAFLEEASEVMQFHVRKIYTTEGRRIDSVQSLMVCPGVLVCVGREALNPMLLKILRKGTEGTLPGLGNKSTGLYPRTPGNGTRSPSFQEARSSPHGPQSRASECSEGQESKKSVNFGLETKKSIIHPRSDSSTRSTRLSLSSEKSYGNGIGPHSQHRPAIMNDDIEKRVLVNKDGSLSVEMRVRFRLCNDETLKWSTQIGKSPSLTSDCYPPSHAHVSCLQNGQSESCSDCATFERDYLDDANQSLHAALDVSQCPCCYQMQGQQYNLWENPIHSQKQTPVSPQYVASHTHTTIRHTHSSCSSSSCNSMRVMRCRAKISSCGRGSDSEQSQLVQEETCVMEQVEQRVDMGQNEDSNVEVCMMSRCSSRSEVVTMNANVSSPCERSLMDEAMEEEVNHPLSRISSSSHVLQSLKEDQDVDDDLPASASQCSHRSKPSSNAQPNDNQSISHFTEHDNLEDRDNIESQTVSETAARDQTITFSSNVSRASCRSTDVLKQKNANGAVKSFVKASSGTSTPSRMSSVCPNCGGYKSIITSNCGSRSSQRSCHTPQAVSSPTLHLENQENANYFANDDALSTKSNRTNLTGHRSNPMSSAISRTPSPEPTEGEQERVTKSNISQKSASTSATTEKKIKKSSSATTSAESNKSLESDFGGAVEKSQITDRGICDNTAAKSSPPNCSADNIFLKDTNSRSPSCLSINSIVSMKSSKKQRPISVLSTKSSKSIISEKSKTTISQSAIDEPMGVEPIENEDETGTCLENSQNQDANDNCKAAEERAISVLSTKSTTSCPTDVVSNCITGSPDPKEGSVSSIAVNGNELNEDKEQVSSTISMESKSCSQKSVSTKNLKSSSQKGNMVTIKTPEGVNNLSESTQKKANVSIVGETLEERNTQRKTSAHSNSQMLSPKRIRSSQSHLKKVRVGSPCNSDEVRGQSALSVHSVTSSKSGSLKRSVIASTPVEGSKKGTGEENKAKEQGNEMEINEVGDSRSSDKLSKNSSGSVSLGLLDDQEMCDTDSGTSCMSFYTDNHNKDRVRTPTPHVQLVLSDKSTVPTIEAPSSNGEDPPEDDICAGPASSTDNKVVNGDIISSSLSSACGNVKNPKLAQQNVDASNVEANIKASCYLADDTKVNSLKPNNESPAKATDSGSIQSVKTSSSTNKEKSSRQGHSKPCSKATCGESTMSAADLLKDTKTGNQSCQESSKANKASNKQHVEKSKIKRSQKDQPERTEVTPACLPNASPNEVVSDWLRSIPAKSNMIAPDEFIENGEEGLVNDVDEPTASKEQHIEDRLDNIQKAKDDEKEGCAAINEGKSTDLAIGVGLAEASPQVNSSLTSGKVLPKDWRSSAAVMKVLLSSSLGRCRSLPEVSPVYGRRLSTSARGLLDCLAQLQLIEPMGCQSCKQHEDRNRQYGDIIAILQSLWLAEPLDIENKDTGKDQGTPPRSSSGVGMSSGSGGSGKEHDNQGGDEAIPKESSHEDDVVENVLEETIKPQTLGFKTEVGLEEQTMHSEEQSQAPPLLDSPKDVNHSSSDKSSTSSATPPPRLLQLSLSNKPSQDPDPVWVLHLLKKLEREFMNHYIDAMAEFKVRWDLEDSLILDTMVAELKDEVNSRIQSSIKREMSKIQSRSGRDGRSPRPPKGTNLSRESTMTEKRRRMLKIMKNQSVKTAESFSDSELTPEFSDQRSDDDYCPCDACVRKKMAARPLKMNPAAVEAPVMMEFDLLKILQLKKTPEKVTAAVSQPTDRCNDSVAIEEVRSLEVVHEEEEEEESSEESKTVLKEPIIGEEKDAKEEAETGEEVIAADDDEEKAEREKENGGEAAERSNDEADGSEEECKATEDTTNQDQEGTTLLEENRHTSISGGADDEDEEQADGGTRESHEKDKLLQQDRASQKAHSATGDVCMMNYEEADAENDSEHPSDTGTNESGNKEDTTEVDRSMVSDNVLLHQFTKSSVESQQGSLED
ncbi:retinitis pigmentosa 1-like 1 protein [Corythoichthys intestinalis]|uniref:retinitis pigmentosa 1-like 1 protein n=1 Tax=Corythoichthys intestinalis TaxID=161448 RepID=UPI0025A5A805|nr:retinitis pigmentosa 1-like 1 protein [Corythoichthys intestinalis]XP_057685883.1 retinitis pigmentosa 1-like 1 protein [Corythoichthys intestinalis]XP_057685884.1 retinitis pigmentosa 1-like 1 protein [Corythoichthys intestinalis]XP_057685885.1 retinitis pigmentosa 1-like 1 protein [Corythoichthys intestinalis]XP_057685886.1 retinitis pigmentosa 1-like 1 protein [Corythoichthys intestinalis]XP_057685888.1 retinitis pigmentosa 1-like 1 protein [Corythoichthys intestinalis]XP_057685889.1 re